MSTTTTRTERGRLAHGIFFEDEARLGELLSGLSEEEKGFFLKIAEALLDILVTAPGGGAPSMEDAVRGEGGVYSRLGDLKEIYLGTVKKD